MRRWWLNMQSEHGEIIIFQAEDGQSSLQVHLEKESVWLSQKQMADLFAKDVRTVNEHIQNVYSVARACLDRKRGFLQPH